MSVSISNCMYVILLILCISSILAYGHYRCKKINTKNKKFFILEGNPIFKLGNFVFDKWSISHICFFAILGFFYPNSFYISMILGVIWEIVEFALSYYEPKWFFDNWRFGGCPNDENSSINEWWFFRWNDILMNCIGFFIGMKLSKLV